MTWMGIVHEAQLDTAADSAVCPSRRCSSSPDLSRSGIQKRRQEDPIPILQVLQDDRAANLLHFQGAHMLVTFRSNNRQRHTNRHYPQSYHDLLFVRWQGGGTSAEERSP